MRKPWTHQLSGIQYLRAPGDKALLWEMRLGKSLVVIQAFHDAEAVLIVCPKTVIGVWEEEFRDEGLSDQCLTLTSSEVNDRWVIPRFTITNYEAVLRMPDWMLAKFSVVVLDEAVRIKNPQSKLAKFFTTHFQQAKKVVASGNLAPESPLEYFTPMKFLHGKWMGCHNYWQFRQTYFASDPKGWSWWPKSQFVKDRIKQQVAKDSSILTRTQAGLANQKIFQRRYVELPADLRKMYDSMEKDFAMTTPTGKEIEVIHTVAQVGYLSQLAGGGTKDGWISDHKITELLTLLQSELREESVVVWFRYNWEIARAGAALTKAGVTYASLTGEDDTASRTAVQQSFRKKEVRVLLVQIKCGLYGLNLSVSSTAIYFSNPLSGNERTQSEDRIEHNTKREPLLFIDLIAKDTVDEDVVAALRSKWINSRFFLGEVINNMRQRRGQHVNNSRITTKRTNLNLPLAELPLLDTNTPQDYGCADFHG